MWNSRWRPRWSLITIYTKYVVIISKVPYISFHFHIILTHEFSLEQVIRINVFLAQLTSVSWSFVDVIHNSHYQLLPQNWWTDSLPTCCGSTWNRSLPSLFKWSCSSSFWIFQWIFCSFFLNLKEVLLKNRSGNCFQIAQGHFWVPQTLTCSPGSTAFFSIFN